MEQVFTSEFFVGNRERLRELFTGTAPIVLTANGLLQLGADVAYPFHQDASFWYFTGCDEPDVVLVMDKEKEYLIVPPRDNTRVVFEGAIDETLLKRISGVETIYDEQQGWRQLGSRLKKAKHVATLAAAPAYIERLGIYSNPSRRRLLKQMKAYNEGIELLDIGQHVLRLRMTKQAPELVAMQRAIDITGKALKQVIRQARSGKYEYEYQVEADLARSFLMQGAAGHAFAPTIAGGARACTLHNGTSREALSADELLLCDVGAEFDHYAADITRTFSVKAPSRRQQAVYAAVLEVHAYAVSLLRPGVLLKEYESDVEHFMGEKLRELGLIKTIERETVRQFYPHATSHFLGLNAHDGGLYDRPLEPGVVVTVEPGIYIPAEGLGIRVEDDVLITADGSDVLSDRISRDLV